MAQLPIIKNLRAFIDERMEASVSNQNTLAENDPTIEQETAVQDTYELITRVLNTEEQRCANSLFVIWHPDDLCDAMPDSSLDERAAMLDRIHKALQSRMIELGNEVIADLVANEQQAA